MKTIRRIAVFPLEIIVATCVAGMIIFEVLGMLFGQLCQIIAGDGE